MSASSPMKSPPGTIRGRVRGNTISKHVGEALIGNEAAFLDDDFFSPPITNRAEVQPLVPDGDVVKSPEALLSTNEAESYFENQDDDDQISLLPPTQPIASIPAWKLIWIQVTSTCLSTLFLGFVVLYAIGATVAGNIWGRIKRFGRAEVGPVYAWDEKGKWKAELITKDPGYYIKQGGCEVENHTVETGDGFFLRLQRIIPNPASSSTSSSSSKPAPSSSSPPPYPILILHGLFQSSGSFITSEDRSLAMWLASQKHEDGAYKYDVFLGNTRGVFDMGHKTLKRSQPEFWDWTPRTLATYDLPALVKTVLEVNKNYDKLAFIGHSQGNGCAFISLSKGIRPDVGASMSYFAALGPAVYGGELTAGFPFTLLGRMEWRTWKRFFGVLDFIPIMTWAYNLAPAGLFASLGYIMFAFLFKWTDTNWLKRRKRKMFRFTPSPVSSQSIFWWAGKDGFATRGCLFDVSEDKWFDSRFPPLSVYYGGQDFLVLAEPLLERLEKQETDVKVLRVKKIDVSEHCDFYWAAEAVEWCFHDIVEDIEKTRVPPISANGAAGSKANGANRKAKKKAVAEGLPI